MNVLMVLQGQYPPDSRIRKQVKSLLEAGHQVRILCESDTIGIKNIDGATVRYVVRPSIGMKYDDIYRTLVTILKNTYPFLGEMIREELEKDIDIVHVHDLPLAKTVLEESDVPVILDLHENFREAIGHYRSNQSLRELIANPKLVGDRVIRPVRRYRRDQQVAMENADHVLATVPEAREAYIQSGIDPSTISVVSNTVDIDWFDKHMPHGEKSSSEEFILTYVGTLSGPHRGLDTAIQAISEIKEKIPEVQLKIAGGGNRQEPLAELAEDLNVDKHVKFTGWIDETEFPKYMKEADIGLVPHRSNSHTNTTVPHKLFQYMAAELPVIVTDTAAVGRIVRETGSGHVIPPESPSAIAESTIELRQGNLLSEYGRNGREAVESTYNWARDGNELKKVYSLFGN